MITVKVDTTGIDNLLRNGSKEMARALEIAMDKTVRQAKDDITAEIPKAFNSPTPYTKNSVRHTPTRNHNFIASVELKNPYRNGAPMRDHYLAPQVDGGQRRAKGFERGIGHQLVLSNLPSTRKLLNDYGNLPVAQVKRILAAVKNPRSSKKELVHVKPGNTSGLIPGIYERFSTNKKIGKARRDDGRKLQRGRKVGKFYSAIRARGLRPVLLYPKQTIHYRPRLPFYKLAESSVRSNFERIFNNEISRRLGRL
jgi:hypothetical protein